MSHAEDLIQSLYVMASLVEARDPYTGGHLWRVSQFSRLLAADAALPGEAVARMAIGGFLHDLGKIGVPDAILNKPGRLGEQEYEVIKTHPEVGARLLAGHPLAQLVRAAVLCHHEMPNGRGYPQGLCGSSIPLEARIVGVCDAFDAMTSTRPYRRGMAKEVALAIIEDNLGTQFDADLGAQLIALGRLGALDPIIGHTDAGIPLQNCPVCGPTIVVRRAHRHADTVFCRHCGGEARIEREGEGIRTVPTGRKGSAGDLQPEVDIDLVGALAREVARHVAA